MAKTSVIARNQHRKRLVDAKRVARAALKEQIRTAEDDVFELVLKLQKRKRNESAARLRNRCRSCGRPRATLRKFGLCRICLRQAAMRGDVPGLKKASW